MLSEHQTGSEKNAVYNAPHKHEGNEFFMNPFCQYINVQAKERRNKAEYYMLNAGESGAVISPVFIPQIE